MEELKKWSKETQATKKFWGGNQKQIIEAVSAIDKGLIPRDLKTEEARATKVAAKLKGKMIQKGMGCEDGYVDELA
jgi:hypothetical protein